MEEDQTAPLDRIIREGFITALMETALVFTDQEATSEERKLWSRSLWDVTLWCINRNGMDFIADGIEFCADAIKEKARIFDDRETIEQVLSGARQVQRTHHMAQECLSKGVCHSRTS